MTAAWILIISLIFSTGLYSAQKTISFFDTLQKFESRSHSNLYCSTAELISAAKSYNSKLSCILPRIDHAAYATGGSTTAAAFCFFDPQFLSTEQEASCKNFARSN